MSAGQEFSPEKPLPVLELVADGGPGKYVLRCRVHPDLLYTSADPRGGAPIIARTAVCECSWVQLEVIGRNG